ncbi:MAG: bacterial Ig-like domain-containing protein [Clostridia bacterium]|nr:bacterial Ig-like domain-containing protein [Clostridia bacterium]
MKNKKLYVIIITLSILLVLPSMVIAEDEEFISEIVSGLLYANRFIISPEENLPSVAITHDQNDNRKITIVAKSKNDIIEQIKYAKKIVKEEMIDFSVSGTELNFTRGNKVTITHTFEEDGIYDVFVKDSNDNQMTYTVIAYKDYPVSIGEVSRGDKQISFVVKSTLANITQVKVVDSNSFEDVVELSPAREIQINCNKDYGTYKIYAEDALGYKKETSFTLVDENDPPNVTINKEDGNNRSIKIVAESKTNTIQLIKYAKKANKDERIDFATNGTEIPITPDKKVNVSHLFEEDGIYAIYVKDAYGKANIYTVYAYKDFPITIQKIRENKKTIKYEIISNLSKIVEVKIRNLATLHEEPISINQGMDVVIEYTVPDYGSYIIQAQDELGFINEEMFSITDDIKIVTSIMVNTMPSKTKYKQNSERLNLEGGKIVVVYDDYSTDIIEMTDKAIRATGFDNSKVGENTITIEYGGKTTKFNVNIEQNI